LLFFFTPQTEHVNSGLEEEEEEEGMVELQQEQNSRKTMIGRESKTILLILRHPTIGYFQNGPK
jgi:hypothetical protein